MGRIFRYGISRDRRVHHRRRIFRKIAIMVSTTAEIAEADGAPRRHPRRPLGVRSLAGGNTGVREIIAHGRHIGLHPEVKIHGRPQIV